MVEQKVHCFRYKLDNKKNNNKMMQKWQNQEIQIQLDNCENVKTLKSSEYLTSLTWNLDKNKAI